MTSALGSEPPPVVLETADDLAKLHGPTVGPTKRRKSLDSILLQSWHGPPGYAPRVDEIGAATFGEEVLASPVPVVVDFWAPWCKPCEAIAPHLESLAALWGPRARLVRVNVDDEPGLSGRYGVLSLPTVILFAGGEPKATVYGAQPRARFEREFAPHL